MPRPPRPGCLRGPGEHTADAIGLVGLALCLALGCSSAPPTPHAPAPTPHTWTDTRIEEVERLVAALAEADAPAEGAVRVRLAFGEAVDLDLFVSDPLQETVYFANARSRSGGRLLADRRCGMQAPRIETVEWSSPPPGRYRVGIDFPRRCEGSTRVAVYALAVERGGRRTIHRGMIEAGSFLPEVDRFDFRP